MQLNATLIVQILHFWVAYLIVRYIVLKPFIRQMSAEEQARENLIQMIEGRKQLLQAKEQERLHYITLCKQFFIAHAPSVSKESIEKPGEYVQIVLSNIDQHQVREAVSQTKQVLIRRMVHD